MMKIYDIEGFPNPARIRIALAEKGIIDQVEFIPVDVLGGEHRQPEFLAKNPNAAVPVLELDCGTCISECTAITEYIDHTYAGISLTGTSAQERAIIHMMQRRAESNVLDAIVAYFHHATDGLGPDIEIYQNQCWGEKQKEKALDGLGYFNRVLETMSYVAGDNFSVADITLYAGVNFTNFIKVPIPQEYTHLQAWFDRVSKRASIAG
jgi:glutathione S-transferase